MRSKLVAGNWKMNGTRASAQALIGAIKQGLSAIKTAQFAICPPAIYLADVEGLLQGSGIAWGAQNVSSEIAGAYTGEISAAMLVDLGCRYVIIGHSERRALYAESDTQVAQKFGQAIRAGLTPILCVGESLQQRDDGSTQDVVARQLDAVLMLLGISAFASAVIAYEPVWAIGTGKTASPAQAQQVHAFIRQRLAAHDAILAGRIQIIYGGSVKAGNARELFGMPDIDGGLIGGASLDADEFLAICQAAG
ncbi:MAG: triose-phosphate isomerase [Gammaproteobacteria bacterium]